MHDPAAMINAFEGDVEGAFTGANVGESGFHSSRVVSYTTSPLRKPGT